MGLNVNILKDLAGLVDTGNFEEISKNDVDRTSTDNNFSKILYPHTGNFEKISENDVDRNLPIIIFQKSRIPYRQFWNTLWLFQHNVRVPNHVQQKLADEKERNRLLFEKKQTMVAQNIERHTENAFLPYTPELWF